MKTTQFDSKTNSFFTTELTDGNYFQNILGPGYFVIVNPHSINVSFSKSNRDVCFGDIVSDVIPNYTNQQYADDYGDKLTGTGLTVREFMQKNCRMNIK